MQHSTPRRDDRTTSAADASTATPFEGGRAGGVDVWGADLWSVEWPTDDRSETRDDRAGDRRRLRPWRTVAVTGAVVLAIVSTMLFVSTNATAESVLGPPFDSPVALAVAALVGVFALRAGLLLGVEPSERGATGRRRLLDAAAVLALVGGAAYVLAVVAAPSPPWLVVGVGLAVGLVVAFAHFGPMFPWSPDGYRRQFEAYRERLAVRSTLFESLLANADGRVVPDSEVRDVVVEAKAALATAEMNLRRADEALTGRLPDDALFHFYAAKRELLAVDYAIELLKDRLAAVSDAAATERATPLPAATDGSGGATRTSNETLPVVDGRTERTRGQRYLDNTAASFASLAEAEFGEESPLTRRIRGAFYDKCGEIRDDVDVETLERALRSIQDRWQQEEATNHTVGRLLRLGTLMCLAGFGALFSLVVVGGGGSAFVPLAGLSASATLVAVGLFGFFGALASVLFALKDISASSRSDPKASEAPVNRDLVFARLVVGALMGVLAYVLVTSGLFTAVTDDGFDALLASSTGALSVAFAAGFVERLVADRVERFATRMADD